jgi:hypothetical protein
MLVFDSAIIQSRNNRPICFKNANPRRSHEERVNKHVTLDIFQYQLDTISHQSEKNDCSTIDYRLARRMHYALALVA